MQTSWSPLNDLQPAPDSIPALPPPPPCQPGAAILPPYTSDSMQTNWLTSNDPVGSNQTGPSLEPWQTRTDVMQTNWSHSDDLQPAPDSIPAIPPPPPWELGLSTLPPNPTNPSLRSWQTRSDVMQTSWSSLNDLQPPADSVPASLQPRQPQFNDSSPATENSTYPPHPTFIWVQSARSSSDDLNNAGRD